MAEDEDDQNFWVVVTKLGEGKELMGNFLEII